MEFITENSAELYEICTRQTNTTGAVIDEYTRRKVDMALETCGVVFAAECPKILGFFVYDDPEHADCFLLSVEGGAVFCLSSKSAECDFTTLKILAVGAQTEHIIGGPIYELNVPSVNAEQEAKDAEENK